MFKQSCGYPFIFRFTEQTCKLSPSEGALLMAGSVCVIVALTKQMLYSSAFQRTVCDIRGDQNMPLHIKPTV